MKEFEKVFKERFIEYSNEYEYNDLKNKRGRFYEVMMQTINEILKRGMKDENLILINHSFNNLRLTVDKPKIFVFCGCYMYKGEKIILLSNKLGYYTFDNPRIVKQLTSMRIGTKLELKKTEFSIDLRVPESGIDFGLFKTENEQGN